MAAVYVNNLVVNSGSDFNQSYDLEGINNSPLNLTDHQVNAQMRKWAGSSVAITFTTSILYPSTNGKILILLSSEDTANIRPGRYVYDIIITDSFEVKTRVVEGMVLVREGVTR